jgi:hypothetical protein
VLNYNLIVTYEWAQLARVFVPGKPLEPGVTKHSSILDPFVSYKENEVLQQRFLVDFRCQSGAIKDLIANQVYSTI